jgi:pyridoxal biosynthesis lyase PdxS
MVAKCNVYIQYTLQESIATEANSTSMSVTRVPSDIKAAGNTRRVNKGLTVIANKVRDGK